jgi:hypothetical protein
LEEGQGVVGAVTLAAGHDDGDVAGRAKGNDAALLPFYFCQASKNTNCVVCQSFGRAGVDGGHKIHLPHLSVLHDAQVPQGPLAVPNGAALLEGCCEKPFVVATHVIAQSTFFQGTFQ